MKFKKVTDESNGKNQNKSKNEESFIKDYKFDNKNDLFKSGKNMN